MDSKKRFFSLDVNGDPQPGNWWDACFLLADKDRRTVGDTRIGHVRVSTVFLVQDHNFLSLINDPDEWGDHSPILYETMIFGGRHNEYCRRYRTKAEAKKGHWQAVRIAATAILLDLFWNRIAVVFYSTVLVILFAILSQVYNERHADDAAKRRTMGSSPSYPILPRYPPLVCPPRTYLS